MAEPMRYLATSLVLLLLFLVMVTKGTEGPWEDRHVEFMEIQDQEGCTEKCCPKFLIRALGVIALNVRSGLWDAVY